MKEIALNHGMAAIIDDSDYERVAQYRWIALRPQGPTYAICSRKVNGKNLLMHRLILDAPDNQRVDHINGNGLDNRRENLRFASQTENLHNTQKSRRKDATSRYKGVSLSTWRKGWYARITINGNIVNLGKFHSEIDAALAYDAAAREHFGEFAYLNFPHEKPA